MQGISGAESPAYECGTAIVKENRDIHLVKRQPNCSPSESDV